jgi:hypothetical protein
MNRGRVLLFAAFSAVWPGVWTARAQDSLSTNPFPTVLLTDRAQASVDVLMASVPEAIGLRLLPSLRDPEKVTNARAELLRLIATGQAKLISWPHVTVPDSERTATESHLEQRYPSSFQQPQDPNSRGRPNISPAEIVLNAIAASGGSVPQAHEVRYIGAALDAGARIAPNHAAATLQMSAQYVRFHHLERFPLTSAKDTPQLAIPQPIFGSGKISTTLTLRHGEQRLVYAGKQRATPTRMELFIIGLQISPPISPK